MDETEVRQALLLEHLAKRSSRLSFLFSFNLKNADIATLDQLRYNVFPSTLGLSPLLVLKQTEKRYKTLGNKQISICEGSPGFTMKAVSIAIKPASFEC